MSTLLPRRLALGPLLATLIGVLAWGPLAEAQGFAGRPLTEALLELENMGLELLFTSQVVRPDMRVETEPTATSPRAILLQLLAAHGLEAREGPGGRLVIVKAEVTTGAVHGRALDGETGTPLADVQILAVDTTLATVTNTQGSFEFLEVPPGTYILEARRPGYVVDRSLPFEVAAGSQLEITLQLVPAPVPLDEIVVTPSQISLLRSDPVSHIALEKAEIEALPHLGDDLFRALSLLPGVSGNEFSAQFSVRGGRPDETLVLLDRLELFDPYHIKDFGSALSFIAPQAIAEVDLILGGFPAPFGDRMGGVLDMRTVDPVERRTHLGLSIIGAQIGGSGSFPDDRGRWLGVARYGDFALAKDFVGAELQPRYWDVFGKVERDLDDRHQVGLRTLHAEDNLDTQLVDEEELENTDTFYRSSYAWLTHRALLSSEVFVESVLSRGRIERNRQAVETEDNELELRIRDQRVLDVTAFKQDWNFETSNRLFLRWGFEARWLDVEYDYLNELDPDDTLDSIRGGPQTSTTRFLQGFDGNQYSVYLTHRLRISDRLTSELGLRYDEHEVPGDEDVSPRVNLVAALGESTTLRAAWGHYFQSQRLYELQVEDGETRFFPSERTEQFGLGLEHTFQDSSSLRIDLYHRDIARPRPRYENIYEPVVPFPEVQPDRIRFAPERAESQGIELFYRGRSSERIDWWINYAWTRVRDEIGGRDVPRSFDQPHSLNANLVVRLGPHWSLNFAFRYHTGWPTTAVGTGFEVDDEGEIEAVPVFGPLNGDRLSDYHRLDLRASRSWQLKKGTLSLFIEVQNLYDRHNLAGFDVELEALEAPDGQMQIMPVRENWAGILPSFGLDWEF